MQMIVSKSNRRFVLFCFDDPRKWICGFLLLVLVDGLVLVDFNI